MLDCDNDGKKEEEKAFPFPNDSSKAAPSFFPKVSTTKWSSPFKLNLLIMEADNTEEPITIYVNSPGGSADCGFAIFDLLRYVESPIITVCSGICASAAILIFLASEKGKRYSLPNSRFLLAPTLNPSTGNGLGPSDHGPRDRQIAESRYNEIVSEEVGQSVEKITEDSARDFWLTARRSLRIRS